jgi:hypothetical protein
MRFDAGQMARAGICDSLRSDGTLAVVRGHVGPEDEEPVKPVAVNGTPEAEAAPSR